MYTIPAEVIIANYFAEIPKSNNLKLSTLAEIKIEVEKEFHDMFLFVDLSGDSIAAAVRSNPKYFSFDDSRTTIIFNSSQREDLYEDVYAIFNAKLEQEIKYKLLVSLEKILSTMADNCS